MVWRCLPCFRTSSNNKACTDTEGLKVGCAVQPRAATAWSKCMSNATKQVLVRLRLGMPPGGVSRSDTSRLHRSWQSASNCRWSAGVVTPQQHLLAPGFALCCGPVWLSLTAGPRTPRGGVPARRHLCCLCSHESHMFSVSVRLLRDCTLQLFGSRSGWRSFVARILRVQQRMQQKHDDQHVQTRTAHKGT